MDEKRARNRANWEDRVPVHVGPSGYDLDAFDDPEHLGAVVRFDLPRLGRIEGLDVAHLQCHIGTDTVSPARLGARTVLMHRVPPFGGVELRDRPERLPCSYTLQARRAG